MGKPQALRQAILDSKQLKKDPYYWASFTIFGSYHLERTVNNEKGEEEEERDEGE